MTSLQSGALATWAAAWLAGRAAFDDVLEQVPGHRLEDHTNDGRFSTPAHAGSMADVLITWRQTQAAPRVVLPVAGDVRGLPGPAHFRSLALEAGQAVLGGGLGLVPEPLARTASSASRLFVWHVHDIEDPPRDFLPLTDAQHELTEAIRESASALSAADVAGWIDDVREELSDARRAGERLHLPSCWPVRAVQLLAQAERLAAVLDVAFTDPTGGAIDRTGIAARADALRPLSIAVRRARVAGYNAFVDAESV